MLRTRTFVRSEVEITVGHWTFSDHFLEMSDQVLACNKCTTLCTGNFEALFPPQYVIREYRKSGNFRVKNFSCDNFSCSNVFVHEQAIRKYFNNETTTRI